MIRAGALVVATALTGCAAPPPVTPATTHSASAPADDSAAFRVAKPGLRRIGYRNCDGFAVELFAPRSGASGGPLFVNAYSYRGPQGVIRLRLPDGPVRSERQVAGRWQDLPLPARAGGRDVTLRAPGGAVALSAGQAAPLLAGRYRLSLGRIMAQRGAAVCALSPIWIFDQS